MKKRFIRSKRVRYGSMTVLLTVLLIATVVLANVLVSTLASRYTWYTSMTASANYGTTNACYNLLDATIGKTDEKVKIIFCDTEENVKESSTVSYIYNTAKQLCEHLPDNLSLEFHNIWLDPDSVRGYSATFDASTAETVKTTLKSTSVIIAGEDYYRVYDHSEFFVFADNDTSNLWAYQGERKLSAGILHAVENDSQPICCLTSNHGEVFYDYELLYLLDDAGYALRYIDLYRDEIPTGCKLIVSYNPNSDLTVSDGVSATSEIDILNDFLSTSGNSFLVFIEDGTPSLPNFESFLSDWGVESLYSTDTNGNSFRYMVQNDSQSLTSDGYTIYGDENEKGHAGELLSGLTRKTVFKNATALRASNGFVSGGDGSYTKGNRTLYSLFGSGSGAVAWANGKPVDATSSMLMTLTEQTNTDSGASYVGVCASVDFASEDFLQSAVYGNTDTMMRLFTILGKENTPEGLTIKPFTNTKISTITTAEMWKTTVILAVIPAVICAGLGIFVPVRRRRA